MDEEVNDISAINQQLSNIIESSNNLLEEDSMSSSKDITGLKAKKFIESSIEFYNKLNFSSKNDKEKIDSLQKYLDYMRNFQGIIKQKESLKEYEDSIESLVNKLKESIIALKVALIKRLNESKEEKEAFISSLITVGGKSNLNTLFDSSNKKGALIEIWEKAKKSSLKFVLLYGPKGNGKELLTKHLSKEVNSYYLNLNFPDLFNHIENFPVALEKYLSMCQPIIIYIPNIEDYNNKKDKLIYFITKILGNKSNQVLIIASSNNPEVIDQEIAKYFANKEYIGPISEKNKHLYVKELLKGYKYNITEEQFKNMGTLFLKYSNNDIKKMITAVLNKANTDGVIEYQQIIDKMSSYQGSISAEVLLKFKQYK